MHKLYFIYRKTMHENRICFISIDEDFGKLKCTKYMKSFGKRNTFLAKV